MQQVFIEYCDVCDDCLKVAEDPTVLLDIKPVADLRGRSRLAPQGPKMSQFHAVFRKM